jgi:ankyrin repeat protein
LHGFFKIVENVDKPDDIGDTGLCLALMSFTLDISMIQNLLDNLADPNQKCRGMETTPVGVVLTQGNGSAAQRSELLKLLLAHGGDPNPMWFQWHAKEFCKNENRCVPLLPVLEPAWAAWDAKAH